MSVLRILCCGLALLAALAPTPAPAATTDDDTGLSDTGPATSDTDPDTDPEEARLLRELASLGIRPETLGRRFAGPDRVEEYRDGAMRFRGVTIDEAGDTTLQKLTFDAVDPRTDENIDFVGGIRGTDELERRVDEGDAELAVSMFATRIEELIDVSDAGMLMPPKSTWFEPKLRSGLLVHLFA